MVNSISILTTIASALLVLASPQKTEEDILAEAYSPGTIAVDLCGLSGANFEEFEAALANDPNFVEDNGTDLYRVYYARQPELRILAVARKREKAFPMAFCRTFLDNADGTSRLVRTMHCEGEVADCEAVFLEFYRFDQETLGY